MLSFALQKLLRGLLMQVPVSVEKFSRWLRGLCTISLARNTSNDRLTAIGYIEQALTVLEHHHESDQVRPGSYLVILLVNCSYMLIWTFLVALSHGRTPMVISHRIQHWNGMLSVC